VNNVETVIAINAEAFSYMLPVLQELQGSRVEIFLPLPIDTHYTNSGKFKYSDSPKEIRQILVFNNFGEVQTGGTINYDPENSEPAYAITQIGQGLIVNSKLKVHKGLSYQQYRVDNTAVEVMGVDGFPVYIKYKLDPHV
jgi:hypothetical protein